ncbi:MAG: leucyl aminopeptidase [Planctomycetaceae bacterium]|nr:leucyl aminopeptidase [Planctomycetaceae bacterium]
MHCEVAAADWHTLDADWLIVCVPQDNEFSSRLAAFDRTLGGTLSRLKEAGDLTGKPADLVALHDVPQIAAKRLLLVGVGTPEKLTRAALMKAVQTAARKVSEKQTSRIAVAIDQSSNASLGSSEAISTAVTALAVGCVGQGLYQKETKRFAFDKVSVLIAPTEDMRPAGEAVRRGQVLGEAMNLTRELVNRPACDVYPESVAETAQRVAGETGLACEVLDPQQIEAERMGSLLAVAQGSDRPPRVVVLRYEGAGRGKSTLALVGKGVTFDSGGLSLKPTEGMKDMKCDMAGAATVLGAMAAIARLGLPVNVVGYMGLVENMISGRSYKLGDVLHARNGVTIEVLNTDAEGRLVLADVLSYAVDHGCNHMVDLATLTGACVVALGEDVTGAFTNDQAWCDAVLGAAKTVGEDVWQLPMLDGFAEQLKSDVADCKNVGTRWGGAITAAKFLEKFVGETPWVHLDIAGPSFASSGNASREGGATGCMVRTLVELAERYGAARE